MNLDFHKLDVLGVFVFSLLKLFDLPLKLKVALFSIAWIQVTSIFILIASL
jgi:hypothetical protein